MEVNWWISGQIDGWLDEWVSECVGVRWVNG